LILFLRKKSRYLSSSPGAGIGMATFGSGELEVKEEGRNEKAVGDEE
jgi:hypothetical protein